MELVGWFTVMAFAIEQARARNASLKEKRPKLVATFIGGNSGIGEETVKQLACTVDKPDAWNHLLYYIARTEGIAAVAMTEYNTSIIDSKVLQYSSII